MLPHPEHSEGHCEPLESERSMDKTIRKYESLKEMKADQYRYWQSRPVHERMSAVAQITLAAYAMKEPVDLRIQRTLVCLQRPPKP